MKQVLDFERAMVGEAPLPSRNFEIGFLRVVRIETDGDGNPVVLTGRGFSVIENMLVEGIVEAEPQMALQGRLGPS